MNHSYIKPLILYKIHEDDNCDKFLNIVRFLYAHGYDIRPHNVIERNFPDNITVLPTIITNNHSLIIGIDNITTFYENLLDMSDLAQLADTFCIQNPNFRISDPSTHKNLILPTTLSN